MAANCAAYLFASTNMTRLNIPDHVRRGHAPTASFWVEAVEGITYVARHPGIGPLLLFAGSLGMLMRAVPEMLPPFVDQLFHRGAQGLATLASTMGCAALIGGLAGATRGRLDGLSRIAIGGGALLILATAGFVATSSFPFAVACAALMGAATTMHGIAVQTLIQSACAPSMIGRVLSLWGLITRAAPAAGALIFGATSEALGLRIPILAACLICTAALAWTCTQLTRMSRALEGGGSE